MGPSLRDHSVFVRPSTRDRPPTQGDNSLVIPSRTSSLHSRITQPIPSQLNAKPNQRTPKTLTHAYMVCGVGREPSQWVKAPPPAQGKIGHMKGALPQFWLPEILGSSPRLEQDNEIARALYAAMRVRLFLYASSVYFPRAFAKVDRIASLTMSKFVPAGLSLNVYIIPLSSSKIHHILYMVLLCAYGPGRMRSVPKRFGTFASVLNRITTTRQKRPTGFLTV